MAEKKYFDDTVYAECRKRGISQRELARMVGVTDSSVSLWLSSHRIPKLIPYLRICDILDLDPAEITFPELEAERRVEEED